MKTTPYDPLKNISTSIRNMDVYWFSGITLLLLSCIILLFVELPFVIKEPTSADYLKKGITCFWLLLILKLRLKRFKKKISFGSFLGWLIGSTFIVSIMYFVLSFASNSLVNLGMVNFFPIHTKEVKTQVQSVEYDSSSIDLRFAHRLKDSKSLKITDDLDKQLYAGDWVIVTLREADNGFLYYYKEDVEKVYLD